MNFVQSQMWYVWTFAWVE